MSNAKQFSGSLVIVGAEAQYAETEYGWIEPGLAVSETDAKPLCRVNRFWEKPAPRQARELLRSGCLWNTFVTIGSAAAFLELICAQVRDVVLSITRALSDKDLATTYARLPNVDFSRDILAHQANRLLVVRDSGSGWADLGSADRVLGVLARNVDQPAWFRQARGFAAHFRALVEPLAARAVEQ
jgi:mannose-1-phosphate guanylyltransferase